MNRIVFPLLGLGMILLVSTPAPAQNFHNQLHTFHGGTNLTKHAAQMGYDYVTTTDAHAYELKRIISKNANTVWLETRDGGYVPGVSSISNAEYDQYTCIRNASTSNPAQRYYVEWPSYYKVTGVKLSFFTNYRSQAAITAAIDYFNNNLDWSNIDAGFIDQSDTDLGYYSSSGNETLYSNWSFSGLQIDCANSNPDYTTAQGFLIYRRAMRDLFRNRSLPVSANPANISTYGQELHANTPFDHYYNEWGVNNDSSAFGIVPPGLVSVETLYPAGGHPRGTNSGRDFDQVLTAAGTAGNQGSWFGSYGEDWYWIIESNDVLATGMNAVQLLRAIPNWDNLVGATSRSWNGAVYSSSNSYTDSTVVYSRHPKTGKLFVVFRSETAVLSLRTSETVVNVYCVDDLFIERGDCAGHFAVDDSEVRLAGSGQLNQGYIVEVR